nr:hypothetical protein [uncultured Rhodopila sp.]
MSSRTIWLIPIEWLLLWWIVQVILVWGAIAFLGSLCARGNGSAALPLAILLLWQGNRLRRWAMRRLRGE